MNVPDQPTTLANTHLPRNIAFFERVKSDILLNESASTTIGQTRIALALTDITLEKTDAIVNPANEKLLHIGGLARIISKKGGRSIDQDSRRIVEEEGELGISECCLTPAGKLDCRNVIHAVGPRYYEMEEEEAQTLLRSTITNIWRTANQCGMGSVSIPAISSGIFGYPKELCAEDILEEVRRLAVETQDSGNGTLDYVRICVFDRETFEPFYSQFEETFKQKELSMTPDE